MYERGVIVAYMVADDDYLMKVKIQNYYTEMTKKDPMFVWPRVYGNNMKGVGKLDTNIPYPEFIKYSTH